MPHLTKLIQQISNANIAYANGVPYLTDDEYHKLWQELHAIDPNNHNLYHTSQGPKASLGNHKHLHQIFSPMKAFDSTGLKTFLTRFRDDILILEPKYDGLGAVLSRAPGENQILVLHGDGLIGRDISLHIDKIHFEFINETLPQQSCEIIITNADWKPELGANQRNVASGLINREYIDDAEILTLISHDDPLHSMELYPPHDIKTIDQDLLAAHTKWKEIYPIDGVMIKVKSQTKRLLAAHDNQTYGWSIAWKPPIQTAWTKITDIEWNVSRHGKLKPIIEYEPVHLCGTVNTHVTGNNARWIKERKLSPGDKILIGKAGEIIPQVLGFKNNHLDTGIAVPSNCPMCHSTVTWQGRDLICTYEECIGIFVKQVNHFYSPHGVYLKSFKERRTADLLQNKNIFDTLKKSIWALLDPYTFNILNDIYNIMGEKITDKYLAALDVINNAQDMYHFISGLGYPQLGIVSARSAYKKYLSRRLSANANASLYLLQGLAEFKRAQSELKNFIFLDTPKEPLVHYTITGDLSARRDDVINYLTKQQWQFQSSITSYTRVLILGDLKHRSTTVKLQDAKEMKIPIITEDQLEVVVNTINERIKLKEQQDGYEN